jgi:tungstate transport system substrate-binding protein
MMRMILRTALASAVIASPTQAAEAAKQILLGSTTSVENSGLLGRILPQFTAATGIEVRVLAQGTGQALATAARGDVDLVLVHDPEAEQRFVAEGHGVDRREIAWNDFVVVGPASDPAHIAGGHDAAAAFRAIATAKAPFVARGDGSGTSSRELQLWRATGLNPAATPASTSTSWYRNIGGGMGAALNAAAAMDAYTLADRGTWLAFGNPRNLRTLVEGGPNLVNRYDVILLAPGQRPPPSAEAARRLADWLASPDGQSAIGGYEVAGQQLFHPSATVTLPGQSHLDKNGISDPSPPGKGPG